jgi:phosphatidate cytidylyltransferase
VASALVLVPLAIATAYWGGWPFTVFWGVAALGVYWEWTALVAGADRRSVLAAGGASVVLAVMLVAGGYRLAAAAIILAMGMLAAAALAPAQRRGWAAAGVPYAGALAIAPIVLRSDRQDGFLALILLFAIVWATDIVAYFAGRAIGGPKLLPGVSPKKTWSGAIVGTLAALVAALIVAKIGSAPGALTGWLAIGALAVILSVVAQGGDLFESFLKRRFGAKDSGHLIPGHGGLMDRLDGFVTASALAALIGLLRGGFDAPGRGLLVW